MLRSKYTVLFEPDVNDKAGGASVSSNSDGKGASSPSLRDVIAQAATASQAAGPDGLQGGGLESRQEGAVDDLAGAKTEKEIAQAVEDGQGIEGDVQEVDTTQEQEPVPDAIEDGEVVPGDKTQDDQPPKEFAKHPAWQRIMSERDADRSWKSENEPLVQAQQSILQYCQAKNLTPEDFNEALELQALRKNDPPAFAQRMQPLFEALAPYTPNTKVTDPDLVDALDKATVSLPIAQELQRSRNIQKGQQQVTVTAQQNNQRLAAVNINTAASQWETSTKQKNPDFKPKAGPNAPDGMYEYTVMRASYLRQMAPPRNEAEAVNLCEQAYKDAVAHYASVKPKPRPTQRQVPSNRNGTPNGAAPDMGKMNLRDIVNGVANGSIKGHHVSSWNRK